MADFAGQLNGAQSIGEALTQAKTQYFLSRLAFSSYDEKTLSEAELYGLPMYGVGHAPARSPRQPPQLWPPRLFRRIPVLGAASSTSPSQGALSPAFRHRRRRQPASPRRPPSGPITGAARLLLHERRPGPGAELPPAAAVRQPARHPRAASPPTVS